MDKYEPLKILGEGSFGKVYLMRQKDRKRLVCVKVIKIKNVPRKEREACCQEVNLLQRLNHPNIVGYEESFLSPKQDSLFIVMQYCDGGDLASRIKAAQGQLLPEGKVLNWFVQMTLGLHYMHSMRILHRDLKTQNIFLLGNGRLVLGDLGISKVLEGTADFAETLIGTPYYMSPEIFQNKPYNHKSDIWALGCVLYECATLNHAFDASSLQQLAAKIIRGRYPPIDERYSSGLRELVAEMLSLDPGRRPDLDSILKRSFIKRHIQDFFVDIMSRPSSSIGEGTMAVRAAAISAVQGDTPASGRQEHEILSLKQQLEELDLHTVIARAMKPPEQPTSAKGALRMAREQASALRREEERKKVVEETLSKLRAEREERLRNRGSPGLRPGPLVGGRATPDGRRGPPQVPVLARKDSGNGAALREREQRPSPRVPAEPPSKGHGHERRHSGGGGSGGQAAAPGPLNDPRLLVQRRATEAEERRRRERKDEDGGERDSHGGRSPRLPEGPGPAVAMPSVARSPPPLEPAQQRRRPSDGEGAALGAGGARGSGSSRPGPVRPMREAPAAPEPVVGAGRRASPSPTPEPKSGVERPASKRDGPPMRSPHGAGKRDAKGGEGEEEDDDVFEMMVREPESDESDEDDDLREREAVLQEELAVATKRMEELKKTLVQTKSFIQQQAPQAKRSGSSSAKSSGSGSGRSRTPEAGPELSLEVTESDSEDEFGGEEESGDYKDERFEEDDEAVAPRKPPTTPSRAVVDASGSKKGLEPLRAPAGVPVAESKSARGSSSSSSSTPRTGKLEDRARDSRALLVRMLGEETFNQAWAALRELHSNVDPKEPLARQEACEKAVMAPILKDKARCLELLKQLLFMTQSLEP